MLHYRGPVIKKLEKLNTHTLPGLSRKYVLKACFKNIFSEMTSFYLQDLIEKQKIKYAFLLTEKSIRKYLFFANRFFKHDLLNLISLRLDIVLFKLGYFKTIKQARQNIGHRFVLVNYRNVMQPSFLIKKGDIISIVPDCSSVVFMCKKNLFEKSIISKYSKSLLLCVDTLTGVILSLEDLFYNFVSYKIGCCNKYYFK